MTDPNLLSDIINYDGNDPTDLLSRAYNEIERLTEIHSGVVAVRGWTYRRMGDGVRISCGSEFWTDLTRAEWNDIVSTVATVTNA